MASRYSSSGWASAIAPSAKDIGVLADEAYRRLPQNLRDLGGSIVIRVEDFPDEETLEELCCETPYDLLGLFSTSPLAEVEDANELVETNMVVLFRRAIIDYWAEHEETLRDIVTHVVVHEVGHHFGLSDDDMARIEAEAEADRGVMRRVQ